MVDFRIILQLVAFILCVFYDGVALIAIPECIEAIIFYAKIVVAEHIEVSECHDLKEDLMGTKFFIIFVKYVVYDWGLGAQVLHMTDFKLHLF